MPKMLQGQELEQRCRSLGVDILGEARTKSSSGEAPRASDAELQRRLIDAERSQRESRLWLIALASAVASVLSAAAALVALLRK